MRLLFQSLIIVLPLATLAFWLCFNDLSANLPFFGSLKSIPVTGTAPLTTRLLCFAINMIPLGAFIIVLQTAIKLFKSYETGNFFSTTNTHILNKIAKYTFAGFIAGFVQTPLLSPILSFHNPVGQRVINVSIFPADLFILLICAMLILITNLMDEARKLKEEQDQVI